MADLIRDRDGVDKLRSHRPIRRHVHPHLTLRIETGIHNATQATTPKRGGRLEKYRRMAARGGGQAKW